jgi:hypothetical protein
VSARFVFLPPPQKFEDVVAFDIDRGDVLDILPGE